ncbi:MAG: hypothetical protein L0241_02540 [Planctomycetia bacterium]|nr:hypothetical protein [Planctomycetia bacterium]
MRTFTLQNSLPEADIGGNVIRLWLASGLVRLGAVLSNNILYNEGGLCWDTTTQRAIWEAPLCDDMQSYPDPEFDRELTRVVYRVPRPREIYQPGYLCVRELTSGSEVRLDDTSLWFSVITPDGCEMFAWASQLRRWRIPSELAGADKLTPNRKWSIRLPSGRSTAQQFDNMLTALAVSSDGKRLAAGQANGAVTVWNVAGPREIAKIPAIKGTKYRRYLAHRLVFSPDGTRLAAVREKPRDKKRGYTVSVWALPGGRQEKGPKEKVSVNGVAFSPDGQTLLTARDDRRIGVWDTATWKLRHEYAWKIGKLFSVAFSPDGLTCAAGGEKGQVVVWDVDT